MLMKPSPSLMLGIDDISFAWLALIANAVPRRPPPDFVDVSSVFAGFLAALVWFSYSMHAHGTV